MKLNFNSILFYIRIDFLVKTPLGIFSNFIHKIAPRTFNLGFYITLVFKKQDFTSLAFYLIHMRHYVATVIVVEPILIAIQTEPFEMNLTCEPIFKLAVEKATESAFVSFTVIKVSAVAAEIVIV